MTDGVVETVVSASSLLERVAAIEPIIREHAPKGEIDRRLPDPVVEAMRDAGLYRLWIPGRYDGLEVDPMTAFRVFEEVSRIDSAAGWNLQIAVLSCLFVPFLPDEGAAEIFRSPDAILGGTVNPPFQAIPADGGYVVTGRMPFVSGCHHCDWLACPAHIIEAGQRRTDESGLPVTIYVFYPRRDAEIIDNWDTLGMRGTGSHDVAVSDLFVPQHLTGLLKPWENLDDAFRGPLYRYTIWPADGALATVALGIARAAIDELLELARTKTSALSTRSLGERPVVQSQIAQAEAKLGSARSYLYDVFQCIWDDAVEERTINEAQKMKVQLAATNAVSASAEAVDLVLTAAGTSAIRNDQRFQRHFRDVHVITQHAFVSPSRYESVGKMLFGLETDWPFFAL